MGQMLTGEETKGTGTRQGKGQTGRVVTGEGTDGTDADKGKDGRDRC